MNQYGNDSIFDVQTTEHEVNQKGRTGIYFSSTVWSNFLGWKLSIIHSRKYFIRLKNESIEWPFNLSGNGKLSFLSPG